MAAIDTDAVNALMTRARREVDEGLLPSCQVALAYEGELVAFETFGNATNESRYVVYSATKAFVAGAMWALIGDGAIDVRARVAELIPEFATNGKDAITIEQVMLHTSGFPAAPLPPVEGDTSEGRCRAFARCANRAAPLRWPALRPCAAPVPARDVRFADDTDHRRSARRGASFVSGGARSVGASP